jgi:hypothetical protein
MPDLVKACYNSVCIHANGHPVNVITQDNFSDFIDIPDYILLKLESGIMTLTHFSNIIRMTLLYKYGGMWIDATMLATGTLPKQYFDAELFSLKREQEGDNVSLCRWTAFFFCGKKDNIFFLFMREFFFEYWKEETMMPDYHLVDYAIATAYYSIPAIKIMFDNIPPTNPQLYYLTSHLNDPFDSTKYNNICIDTCVHKLSWKKKVQVYNSKNDLTFYGYIINQDKVK